MQGQPAAAVALETGDGLSVDFAESDGAVTAVSVNGQPLPLVPGQPGGWIVRVGSRIAPYAVQHLDFDAGLGPITSARNADWDGYGSFVTWQAEGGVGNTGHVLLGDGATEGVGMAMVAPLPIASGACLRISWHARAAAVETSHILCVRIYDEVGTDVTSSANAPPGWTYTAVSRAHGVWGFGCAQPDTWEAFERSYYMPSGAAFARVSLRHWTGGDHRLHLDNFNLDVTGGIDWGEPAAVAGPLASVPGGFTQQVELPGQELRVESMVIAGAGHLALGAVLQDTSMPLTDRPVELRWSLPVAAAQGQWWDDIGPPRSIEPGGRYRHTFELSGHAISLYPFCAVNGTGYGLSLAVPQTLPVVQRFEYDAGHGLTSVWEIGLSPLTVWLGPGRAAVTCALFQHEPAWGFRSATERYYGLFPEYFVKRTRRVGAWMYPILPSHIPAPGDFGFAFLETWELDEAERLLCEEHDIGIFYYTEPWLAWQHWGNDPQKPSYQERVALLEAWAAAANRLVTWLPDGGVNDSGHLLLGDGLTTGAGIATAMPFAVAGGQAVRVAWQTRVSDTASLQILCLRVFDSQGVDITAGLAAPAGWFWSETSQAHTVAGLANTAADTWEPFARLYQVSPAVAAMRVSLRHWNGGDHYVHLDDLRVEDEAGGSIWLALNFEAEDGSWSDAHNSDWDEAVPLWLRGPRTETAQAVINSSPRDAESRYFIDMHPYFWHEWDPGSWYQAWPLNPDPDLPLPSTFDLHRRLWILEQLEENDGVYIDSVSASASIGGWQNRRPEHLAVSDSPLTFAPDGAATQLAPQAQAEFLSAIAEEVRAAGKCMMLNLFPSAMRFHAHNADVMGSEIMVLVETAAESRLRRTLAKQRIVTNLLQWGWDSPSYATYDQMEEFIRGQLFWGFFPGVSSAGGLLSGGTPDRYFLHPELYERDRPLFVRYMPVIRALDTAGWEPITHAAAAPGGEIERFGEFGRGAVLFTVRGADSAAWEGEIAVNLGRLGAAGACPPARVWNVLADSAVEAEIGSDPEELRFAAGLVAGEVGVYRVVVPAAGDFDLDGDVDGGDFEFFAPCQRGPHAAPSAGGCAFADLDCDGDVDQADFARLQRCFGGEDVPAGAGCLN